MGTATHNIAWNGHSATHSWTETAGLAPWAVAAWRSPGFSIILANARHVHAHASRTNGAHGFSEECYSAAHERREREGLSRQFLRRLGHRERSGQEAECR